MQQWNHMSTRRERRKKGGGMAFIFYSLVQSHLWRGQLLLDLRNGQSRVQPLGASPRAVENGVATVHTHAVVQRRLALGFLLVTRVGQPPVGLEEDGGTQVFLTVPPVRGARGRAAGAKDTLVQTVKLLAVFGALTVLKTLCIQLETIDFPNRVVNVCHLHLQSGCHSAGTA